MEEDSTAWQDGFIALFDSESEEELPEFETPLWDSQDDEEYGEEFEEALLEAAADRYYNVQAQQVTGSSLYLACRIGDLDRVRQLIEEGADVNKRDLWDSVPLYYTCLAGHLEVAQCLLEAGASCNEYTFDGERCFYVALTPKLRELLTQYKQKPPPLGPLAMSLRPLSPLGADPEQVSTSQSDLSPGKFSDFAFQFQDEIIPLHRAILAARSPLFRHRLRRQWQQLQEAAGPHRQVLLNSPNLSLKALHAVLGFLYTERLDADMADMDAVQQVVRKCKLASLDAAIQSELRTFRLNFKTARKERAPRRFTLQPGALPADARLGADLGALRQKSAILEDRGCLQHHLADHADLLVHVEEHAFRCHRCILAARSDFFRALLDQPEQGGLQTSPHQSRHAADSALPSVAVGDVGAAAFAVVLQFMYTDAVDSLPAIWHESHAAVELFDAADRLLLFTMKRHVAEAIAAELAEPSAGRADQVEHVCRLLLAADRYAVSHLRDHCLCCLAVMFERLSSSAAPADVRAVFEAFVLGVAPQASSDIAILLGIEGVDSSASVRGCADLDEGPRGEGQGTLLQDLREAFLQEFGGRGAARSRRASAFDFRLQQVAARALQDAS